MGLRGIFNPALMKIVIGGDEPDNALKLKTLYHEYAHSQLHGLKSAFKDRPRAYQETQAEAVAYVAMQNIGVDTGNYSLGYVATWAKDKAVIHSALSEIQQVSNKVIELSDGLTKQLGLQEARKEPEHDLKKLSAHDLNKSYQGLQQQVQQARNPQQKSELKNGNATLIIPVSNVDNNIPMPATITTKLSLVLIFIAYSPERMKVYIYIMIQAVSHFCDNFCLIFSNMLQISTHLPIHI